MPDMDMETASLLTLHGRCKRFRALPFPGSVMDQPALVMDLFDVIDEQMALERKRRADQAATQQWIESIRAKRGNA